MGGQGPKGKSQRVVRADIGRRFRVLGRSLQGGGAVFGSCAAPPVAMGDRGSMGEPVTISRRGNHGAASAGRRCACRILRGWATKRAGLWTGRGADGQDESADAARRAQGLYLNRKRGGRPLRDRHACSVAVPDPRSIIVQRSPLVANAFVPRPAAHGLGGIRLARSRAHAPAACILKEFSAALPPPPAPPLLPGAPRLRPGYADTSPLLSGSTCPRRRGLAHTPHPRTPTPHTSARLQTILNCRSSVRTPARVRPRGRLGLCVLIITVTPTLDPRHTRQVYMYVTALRTARRAPAPARKGCRPPASTPASYRRTPPRPARTTPG